MADEAVSWASMDGWLESQEGRDRLDAGGGRRGLNKTASWNTTTEAVPLHEQLQLHSLGRSARPTLASYSPAPR